MKNYNSICYDDSILIKSSTDKNLCSTAVLMNAISIDDEAFLNNINLREVLFGNNLISIGNDAFNGCENLKFRLPSDIRYIGKRAFAGILSNCSVVIPHTVSIIGEDCFMYSKLNVVYIDEGVRQLLNVFHGAKINQLYLPATMEYISPENYDACDKIFCYEYSGVFNRTYNLCKNKLILRGV